MRQAGFGLNEGGDGAASERRPAGSAGAHARGHARPRAHIPLLAYPRARLPVPAASPCQVRARASRVPVRAACPCQPRAPASRAVGLVLPVPGAVSRAATRAEDLARRGIERARAAADSARDRALDAGDATVHRIRKEPVKAVLIAAAVGAATTLLVQQWRRSRESRALRDRR